MESEEYRLMFEVEEAHWWFKGLRDLICSSIQGLTDGDRNIRILDAGCGTGFLLNQLEFYGLSYGIDISDVALGYCKKRALNRLAQASIMELPFKDKSFDIVVSTDVLYHMQVGDDNCAISEMHRVLKKGGALIVNLPAHDRLRRFHDKRVHTRHRYTTGELAAKMKYGGFEVRRLSYRNSFLLPIVTVLSLFESKDIVSKASDMKHDAGPLGSFFHGLLKIENILLKKMSLPFGTSVFCIAKKNTI